MDRETYRKIKKMSRDEMQDFLTRYADNLLGENGTLDLNSLRNDIGQVKGIGEKRLDKIMSIIEKHLKV